MIKRNGLSEVQLKSQERLRLLNDEECSGKQAELVRKTGVNKALISQYLNGNNSMGVETAFAISRALNVDPLWIMGYDYPRNPSENSGLMIMIETLNDKGIDKLRKYLETLVNKSEYTERSDRKMP